MLIKEDQKKSFVILLRWILIIIVSGILYFNIPIKGVLTPSFFFIPFYILTNLILWFFPKSWFKNQIHIFVIILVDVLLTSLALFLTGQNNSQFYLVFFLILLIATAYRRPSLLYSALGMILVLYGFSLFMKNPETFQETETLFRFAFIIIVTFFLHGMIESYNRIFREKESLAEDYRELEVLTEVAQSIEQENNLPQFLLTLTQLMTDKFGLTRCTAVYIDPKEETGWMISSNDSLEKLPLVLDLKSFPTLMESLKGERASEEPNSETSLSGNMSQYILKTLVLKFRNQDLGTLYLRANTPRRHLTHREQFFLKNLAHVTSLVIYNIRLDLQALLGK
jgi:K+-sensing histidine kinase KdpD